MPLDRLIKMAYSTFREVVFSRGLAFRLFREIFQQPAKDDQRRFIAENRTFQGISIGPSEPLVATFAAELDHEKLLLPDLLWPCVKPGVPSYSAVQICGAISVHGNGSVQLQV